MCSKEQLSRICTLEPVWRLLFYGFLSCLCRGVKWMHLPGLSLVHTSVFGCLGVACSDLTCLSDGTSFLAFCSWKLYLLYRGVSCDR